MPYAEPFARHGCEKMIYDIRMGPQCVYDKGSFYAVFIANQEGSRAVPHITKRTSRGGWHNAVALGDVPRFDHHFAPVLWLDGDKHVHVLSHCHAGLHGSRHQISQSPEDISTWRKGPEIAPSISYPRVIHLFDGRLLLYYRALGHMGYWTYQTSEDGGYSWVRPKVPLVDFDQSPELPGDEWAGSYHSVAPGQDGTSLHIAFVYWDERNQVHPVYGKKLAHMNRYHLYYARLDIQSGRLYSASGKRLKRPVNRKEAEKCRVWDTGSYLTNMPSILVDSEDKPSFLLPVSGERLDDCRFWFVRREADGWGKYCVAEANSTWNGSHLDKGDDGSITAFLTARPVQAGELPYGGGSLQEWRSMDRGESWEFVQNITPGPGLICNNPKPVEDASGAALRRTLVFFGWKGPGGIPPEGPYPGNAYLWQDGNWL
jgi:hypothetical protein